MRDVFADTYYFVALLGPQGAEQQKAIEATQGQSGRLVTTSWIITELANFLHRTHHRPIFMRTYNALTSDSNVLVIEAEQALFLRGLKLFEDRPDKEWSLTDCISFVAMNELGIVEALTADHHFEQAGFIALLK